MGDKYELGQEAETKDSTKDNYYTKEFTISGGAYKETPSDTGNARAKDLKGFIDNTIARGGYYLARYEANKETGNKPLSQANKEVWQTSQQMAATYCRNYTSTGIQSDLVNSYAWDTALIFV